MLWQASETSIRDSVRNAMKLADELGIRSIAFPLIGAGTGCVSASEAEKIMMGAFAELDYDIEVTLVRFQRC
jgi:O-acetyl-ADP-ribose deacetylase (regulator of RNase III)